MKTTSFVNKRKLTPDLASGFMLLFIALAHANQFIFAKGEITFHRQVNCICSNQNGAKAEDLTSYLQLSLRISILFNEKEAERCL
jgi:hypothetical protein